MNIEKIKYAPIEIFSEVAFAIAHCIGADENNDQEIADNISEDFIDEVIRFIRCKAMIGDIVYQVIPKCNPAFGECPYSGGYGTYRCDKCDAYIEEKKFCISDFDRIGKDIFISKEEAEKIIAIENAKDRFKKLNNEHTCKLCGAHIEEDGLKVCNKCASEYKI